MPAQDAAIDQFPQVAQHTQVLHTVGKQSRQQRACHYGKKGAFIACVFQHSEQPGVLDFVDCGTGVSVEGCDEFQQASCGHGGLLVTQQDFQEPSRALFNVNRLRSCDDWRRCRRLDWFFLRPLSTKLSQFKPAFVGTPRQSLQQLRSRFQVSTQRLRFLPQEGRATNPHAWELKQGAE